MRLKPEAAFWDAPQSSIEVQLAGGEALSLDAFEFARWLCRWSGCWLFDPDLGRVVAPRRGSECKIHTLGTLRGLYGDELFLHWVEQYVNEDSESLQETADDAWREMRRLQGIL
jgi:hypothetical protein